MEQIHGFRLAGLKIAGSGVPDSDQSRLLLDHAAGVFKA
jgi:hypothetical protein